MELKLFARRELFANFFEILNEINDFVWRIKIRMDNEEEKSEMLKKFFEIILKNIENYERESIVQF